MLIAAPIMDLVIEHSGYTAMFGSSAVLLVATTLLDVMRNREPAVS